MSDRRYTCIRSDALHECYYRMRHGSGLEIYVFPKQLTQKYAALSVRYGSLNVNFRDADGLCTIPDGVAHFLEHKMFENEDGSDTFEKFALLGANANAYTSTNVTSYLFSCTENFFPSLRLLLSYVKAPYFTEQNIAKEQGIIGREIGMYEDHIGNCLYYSLLGLLYRNHPVKTKICGSAESIAQITPEILYRCYRDFYRLPNMILSVCGDVEPDEVARLVDEMIPPDPGEPGAQTIPVSEPQEIRRATETLYMEIGIPHFAVGLKCDAGGETPVEQAKHGIAFNMLNDILFGDSSTLYETLYSQGKITALSASYEWGEDYGYNILNGEAHDPEDVYREYLAYIVRMKKEGISRGDFERVKRMTYAEYIRVFDSTEEIADELLRCVLSGIDLLTYGNIIQSVTYDDVCRILNQEFLENKTALSIIMPKEAKPCI